jgi:PAS domain S-box-containing protein
MMTRLNVLFQKTAVRYLFGIAAVAITFGLRIWLSPLTGTGAPFALFFAAVLATSLFAGVGPGIGAVLLSLPLGTYAFVVRAGYPVFQAVSQSLLFAIEGFIVCYLTFLMRKDRDAAEDANRQLRRANEELVNSEERFRLTIDEAPIGMALVTLDRKLMRGNRALCEMVGYTPNELAQMTYPGITHPDDVDTDRELLGQLTRGEIPRYRLEKRYYHKTGRIVNIMLSRSVLRGRDDTPLYYITQMEDISERKRAEEELQRAVAVRDQVLGIVAHDLRNPIANIRIACATMDRGGQESARESKEMILRSGERMNRLIEDLLDVSLVEAGQLKLERRPIAVKDLVSDAVGMQAPLASSSSVEIRFSVGADLHVFGDRHRLLQVLENLISNALKFTQAGGHITVGAAPGDHEVMTPRRWPRTSYHQGNR